MVDRGGLTLLFLLAAFAGGGCKKPAPAETRPDAAAPLPHDHLAPDEIPVGKEKAFALPLPRASSIAYRLRDAVEVESPLKPEQLSNFVRAHVTTAKISIGAQTTKFDDVVLPADPGRVLSIEVRPAPAAHHLAKSSMMVRDVTPPPPQPQVSPEDAWRKAGRGPDGRPLDPKNLF